MPLNTATGKAFQALAARISGTVAILIPRAGFSTAANSAVTICSKVTTNHVGIAASAVQAGVKRGAASSIPSPHPKYDTNARMEQAPIPPSRQLVRAIGRWSLAALVVNSIIGSGVFGLPSI